MVEFAPVGRFEMSLSVTVYLFAPVSETLFCARITFAWSGSVSAVSPARLSEIGASEAGGKATILVEDLNPDFTATSE